MAESSILWTTGALGDGTAPYTQAQIAIWINRTFGHGIHKRYLTALAPVGAAPNVTVDTGAGIAYGFPYENTASVSVNIPTPSAGHWRIDRIVLRASWAVATVRITRIAGVEDAAVPAIVRTINTTYDEYICQVLIDDAGVITVTDERALNWIEAYTQVVTAMIEALAVGTTEIAALAITAAKLAADAVTTTKVLDANVTHAKLADDAVEAHNILNATITPAKLNAKPTAVFVWYGGGVVGKVGMEYVAHRDLVLSGGYIIAETAPTGATLILDVHSGLVAGTTIFTTQPNRPTLAIGAVGPTVVVAPDVVNIAAGTRLFCVVDQVGSTITGDNWTLELMGTYALV